MKKKFAVMDGNTAAAHVAYAFTEVAAIYPITPSSPMAEKVDEWSAKGRKNLFGSTVDVIQMQSEAGAAGTCHGSLQAGALTTTFTSSQGLMLMIPAMYAMGGQFLPSVMHIASRVVTSNHHSIFGDHTDFMTCRTTGYAMLMSSCPQEAMDLGAVAHLSAISGKYAFMHCFDGFRTSHEMQRIEALDYEDLRPLVDQEALQEFRRHALNPEHPTNRGNNVNPDVYFQCKEGANVKAASIPDTVQHYMDEINKLTGRDYKLFNYYGAPDAEEVIVVMCSASEAVKETVDYLNAKGRKVGMVQIHLYRPFSVNHFAAAIPATVKKIAVLDRSKETGSVGEPVYLDVVTALNQAGRGDIRVVGGRYGLSSKDTTPGQFIAVYDNLKLENPKNSFTIGINDDVTHTSLDYKEVELPHPGEVSCKIWGLGGDGTVGANKNAISTIGLVANKYAQAYFSYDSMKSGGLTQSHLRFGDEPIRSTYLVSSADFVAVHAPTYVNKYDTTEDLKDGGIFLLNCPWSAEELETRLPGKMKRDLARKHANFYIIDAAKLAVQVGLGEKRTNNILQAAFFALTKVIPLDMAVEDMKKNNYNSYFKKAGQKIVDLNDKAVDLGISAAVKVEIPASWADAPDTPMAEPKNASAFVRDIVLPMDRQQGGKLPVSVFQKNGVLYGTWENGTSAFSKRGVATKVPKWNAESCIQCNRCAMCCPHAAIRPFLFTKEEAEQAPAGCITHKANGRGMENYTFRIQVDPLDCQGCGSCADVCPAREKALVMKPLESQMPEQDNWNHCLSLSEKANPLDKFTVRGSQFQRPLMEFSGACAGCGETPYMKLMTQLFGERMYIANATGCAQAMFLSVPSIPMVKDSAGHGPALSNSLFENNAEYSLGMCLSVDQQRNQVKTHAKAALDTTSDAALKAALESWLQDGDDGDKTRAVSDALIAALNQTADSSADVRFLRDNADQLVKKTMWMYGGDGWAYDIGYGGLDHVLASGIDVNILVVDNELYANTGGQASKATPIGAVAQFAASGKKTPKKDLGMIAMNYGHVYVAQVSMGANPAHVVKALKEAEAHKGPSLVIAYAPCINHGIAKSMKVSQAEQKLAVECGYWPLFRYSPELAAEGKNPFQLDSKAPNGKLREFMMGEVRFSGLTRTFPQIAEQLFAEAEEQCAARYAQYEKLAAQK